MDFIDDLEKNQLIRMYLRKVLTKVKIQSPLTQTHFITKFLLTGFVFLSTWNSFAANGNPFSSDNDSEPAEIVQATVTPKHRTQIRLNKLKLKQDLFKREMILRLILNYLILKFHLFLRWYPCLEQMTSIHLVTA
ncbi:MAG: hypothetical protein CM15mP49_24050 [Actinomycetota bacterium]|nr:MAG: hypothetical protein CM15mP49_24050 [Actinomycetota bacterium]